MEQRSSSRFWVVLLAGLLILLGLLAGLVYYLLQPSTDTARIRDIMIILLAVEGLFIGIALVVLMVQIGLLVYVLHEEVRPILESLQDTAHTVKGTTAFLSDHLTKPVIQIKGYVAVLRSLKALFPLRRAKKRSRNV